MHEVNLRTLDLNLLVVLQALLEARHVSHAAERLNMSQPAVSRALGRLREMFGDALLVRSPSGLVLTERARDLQQPLADALTGISRLVAEPGFDPTTATTPVRLGCLDLEAAIYLAPAVERLRRAAPGMPVEIHSHPDDYFGLLAEGRLHLAISALEPRQRQAEFHRRVIDTIWSECLMSRDNPLASGPMTLDRYLRARHGVVAITGKGPAIMDQRLEAMGRNRRVVLRLSSFFNVPDSCVGTDVVFSLPHRIASRLARDSLLVTRPLPEALQSAGFPMYLYWHSRHHGDPMHQWLRRLVMNGAADMASDPEKEHERLGGSQATP
ncbi:LysR family transcriptional regulator [Spiribacter insolitus]|uniref:LysR family transcriptional regulator n=1 Tax=Spiribacter insolitus TaxID=3122417 RepID=A0ABV3T6N5_9GAMM